MGGNIYSTRRINRETYFNAIDKIVKGIYTVNKSIKWENPLEKDLLIKVVPSCTDKADYGDIDFITNYSVDEFKKIVTYYFNDQYSINNNCISVPWLLDNNEFIQVDFICSHDNFDDAFNYRSYAPLGHICGAIFAENEFVFGEGGLFKKVISTSTSKSVKICNVEEGFTILGISIKELEEEYNNNVTEENLFSYLIKCKYLRWERFKKRDDKEMTSMSRFADFLDNQKTTPYRGAIEIVKIIKIHGDEWLKTLHLFTKKESLLKDFRRHVNGNSVSTATSIPVGPELGELMKKIKNVVEPLIEKAAENDLDPIVMLTLALIEEKKQNE